MAVSKALTNAYAHGEALDEGKKRVKCNYCGKIVAGFSRLRQHIGGIRGDVTPCQQAPKNVKELMRNHLLDRKRGTLSKNVGKLEHPDLPLKRNWNQDSHGVKFAKVGSSQSNVLGCKKHVGNDSFSKCSGDSNAKVPIILTDRKRGSQAADHSMEAEESSSMQVQKCIGEFFYETGVDLCVANSPSFRRMMNAALGHHNIGFQIPSCEELKGLILQHEVKAMQQYVDVVRQSWATTGCSILLDRWIDEKGRNLINILVNCPEGTIYLHSVDISSIVNDVDALLLLLDGLIQEIGVENVVQIVSNSTSGCLDAAGKLLMSKYQSFYWTVCAAHCIEFMLNKIEKMDYVGKVLANTKAITKFIHNRVTILKLFRDHSNERNLFRPSKSKLASHILTLERIVSERENLKAMFSSSEWNSSIWASRVEGKRVADMVGDSSFWTRARKVLKFSIPLVRCWCLIQDDKLHGVGSIYETLDQVKETICEEFKSKAALYEPFWKLIDGIWNEHLHSPLHSAAYVFNPALRYSTDYYYDAEVGSGLQCSMVRLGRKDVRLHDLLTHQVDVYQKGEGIFSVEGEAMKQRHNLTPASWWSKYGGQFCEMQRLAIRILSQTCVGGSRYGLDKSMAEMLLTKGRNRIEHGRLKDLTYVHYNLHLKNFNSVSDEDNMDEEIDPMHDWIAADDEADVDVFQDSEKGWMDLDSGNGTLGGKVTNGEVRAQPSSSSLIKYEATSSR